MNYTISFRRPELLYVLSKMSVPPDVDITAQIRRLKELGYQIIDVSPPLDGYPRSDAAERNVARKVTPFSASHYW